jgi:RimK family alpha-L-glutamate ligase
MIRLASEDLAMGWKDIGGGYPAVAKIPVGSQGKGVFICRSASQLKAITRLVNVLDPQLSIIVQKFVGEAGVDIRCFVVGGKAIGAMKRTGEDIANISAGGHGEPFELNSKIVEISEKISQILGLEIAGIDLLISGEEYILCEANSSPGFKGFDKYCRSNMAGRIADYVVDRLSSPQ